MEEETEVGGSNREKVKNERVKLKKKTVEAVIQQCQRALELLSDTALDDDDDGDDDDDNSNVGSRDGAAATAADVDAHSHESSPSNREADELCDLLKSRIECPDFLEKLESVHPPSPQIMRDEAGSWDMIDESDLWECENSDSAQADYVFVNQEDIVEGIAGFMAAYLLSLKETKDLTPNQLQEALSKAFAVKRKKGKLRKAWEGSQVLYNVASWGATAIGIYKNPAILRAASDAFWASCRVVSKFL